MTLEQAFNREAVSGCKTLQKEYGYNPTYYLRMVQEYGGVGAAKALLRGRDIQDGLIKLWECGRLDMSIEAMVLQPKYRLLFTEEELKIARERLEKLGYRP